MPDKYNILFIIITSLIACGNLTLDTILTLDMIETGNTLMKIAFILWLIYIDLYYTILFILFISYKILWCVYM